MGHFGKDGCISSGCGFVSLKKSMRYLLGKHGIRADMTLYLCDSIELFFCVLERPRGRGRWCDISATFSHSS